MAKIDSPKTLEALKTLGLNTDELLPVNYQEVVTFLTDRDKTNPPKQLVDLRYDMLDKRRYAKKELIIKERNKLIHQEEMQFRTSQVGGSNVSETSKLNAFM